MNSFNNVSPAQAKEVAYQGLALASTLAEGTCLLCNASTTEAVCPDCCERDSAHNDMMADCLAEPLRLEDLSPRLVNCDGCDNLHPESDVHDVGVANFCTACAFGNDSERERVTESDDEASARLQNAYDVALASFSETEAELTEMEASFPVLSEDIAAWDLKHFKIESLLRDKQAILAAANWSIVNPEGPNAHLFPDRMLSDDDLPF